MNYTIFSGCLIQYRFPEYEKSARLILKSLGLKYIFIDSFACCGSQIAESIDEKALYLIAGRNLALAEQKNIDVILTLCGSCTYILKKTHLELQNEQKYRKINKILEKINLPLKNKVEIKHLVELLNEKEYFNELNSKLEKKINLNLTLQNPCMIYRPERISKRKENDISLFANLLEACGAKIIPYDYQDKCCEGTLLAFKKTIGESLVKKRYEAINKLNADLFVVGCPNCQLVYSIFPTVLHSQIIPSIFFTQIIGLALGYSFNEVGLQRNVDKKRIKAVLESTGII